MMIAVISIAFMLQLRYADERIRIQVNAAEMLCSRARFEIVHLSPASVSVAIGDATTVILLFLICAGFALLFSDGSPKHQTAFATCKNVTCTSIAARARRFFCVTCRRYSRSQFFPAHSWNLKLLQTTSRRRSKRRGFTGHHAEGANEDDDDDIVGSALLLLLQ